MDTNIFNAQIRRSSVRNQIIILDMNWVWKSWTTRLRFPFHSRLQFLFLLMQSTASYCKQQTHRTLLAQVLNSIYLKISLSDLFEETDRLAKLLHKSIVGLQLPTFFILFYLTFGLGSILLLHLNRPILGLSFLILFSTLHRFLQRQSCTRMYHRMYRRIKSGVSTSDVVLPNNRLNVCSDLNDCEWQSLLLQHFWPFGLCVDFQDGLNRRYLGSPSSNHTRSLFGVQFEFFEVNSDFAPVLENVHLSHEQTRSDELCLQADLLLDGTATLTDFRDESSKTFVSNDSEASGINKAYSVDYMRKLSHRDESPSGSELKKSTALVYQMQAPNRTSHLTGKRLVGSRKGTLLPTNATTSMVVKTLQIRNVSIHLPIRITLRPLMQSAPFFGGLELIGQSWPKSLQPDLVNRLQQLFSHDSNTALMFAEALVKWICDPFLAPNHFIVEFHVARHTRRMHVRLLYQYTKRASFELRKRLKQLLLHRMQRREPSDKPIESSIVAKSVKRASDLDDQLLEWYNTHIHKQVLLARLHMLQQLHCPIPLFVCFVRIIEFLDLPILMNGKAYKDSGGNKEKATTTTVKSGHPELIWRLRVGCKKSPDRTVAWRHSPLVNEGVWIALHDFGEQFELSVFGRSQNIADAFYEQSELESGVTLETESEDPKTTGKVDMTDYTLIGSVQFPIRKHFWRRSGQRVHNNSKNEKNDLPRLASNLDFFARLGQLMDEHDHMEGKSDDGGEANGRDLWLPLGRRKSGLVHLQIALFQLTSDFQAMMAVNQWNSALTGNPFVRHHRLPVAVLCIYIDRFQVTNHRETDIKKRIPNETRLFELSATVRRQVQRTSTKKLESQRVFWQQQLIFVLNEHPFEEELVLRLHDVTPESFLMSNQVMLMNNANFPSQRSDSAHFKEMHESKPKSERARTSPTKSKNLIGVEINRPAMVETSSNASSVYKMDTNKRIQRQIVGLVRLDRLQCIERSGTESDLTGDTTDTSFIEQLPMYVSADETILEQMRAQHRAGTDQSLQESPVDIANKLEKLEEMRSSNDDAMTIETPNAAESSNRFLQNHEQFGLLHMQASLRYVRPNEIAMRNLMGSCMLQCMHDIPSKATIPCASPGNSCCCCPCCFLLSCGAIEGTCCADICDSNVCNESAVQRKPKEDVKDSELVKMIKQRVDSLQMSTESGVCQVKLRFRLLTANRLEVVVDQAVHVPQVFVLPRMNVRVEIELWKGNYKIASAQSASVLKTLAPTFDFGVRFQLTDGRLSQYVLHVSIVQRTGFWRRRCLMLAEAFCSIPLLDLYESVVYRWYTLTNMSTAALNSELSEEHRSQKINMSVD